MQPNKFSLWRRRRSSGAEYQSNRQRRRVSIKKAIRFALRQIVLIHSVECFSASLCVCVCVCNVADVRAEQTYTHRRENQAMERE